MKMGVNFLRHSNTLQMKTPELPDPIADENVEASEALALALQEKVLLYYSYSIFPFLCCVNLSCMIQQ